MVDIKLEMEWDKTFQKSEKVVSETFGAVKEQCSGLYAIKSAEKDV